ncbi:MAG TPA: hypothetical protein VMM56_05280, partial [Planctomycetaceae bacterium]|nr:hypothetical protein [Planctomycetaceae bacterium]
MDDPLTLQFLSVDLFFQSRLQGHCSACGYRLQPINRLDQIGSPEIIRGLIVDLEFPGLDFQRLGEILTENQLPALGYGSHVKTHLFEAAREAGIENLFSR